MRSYMRNFVRTILLLGFVPLVLGSAAKSLSQTSGIFGSPGNHISTDRPDSPFFETFLSINPRDVKNLIAASMAVIDGSYICQVYATRDGGVTWQRAQTTTADNTIFKDTGADPIVYFDADGTAFFGAIVHRGWSFARWNWDVSLISFVLSRSKDGGFTWEPPVVVPGGQHDRVYLAFDSTGGKFNGRMYVGGTIFVTEATGRYHLASHILFSSDNGLTFSPGKILTADWAGEELYCLADLLVTPEGKLVVPYETFSDDTSSGNSVRTRHLWTMVSEDGGVTFSPAQRGPAFTTGGSYYRTIKSSVAPRAAIDLSNGPYRGRIYLTWVDFDGKKYVVKLAHSIDIGKTWSRPIVVNDNTNDGEPANPAIAVNKEGTLAIVFNDRRDDPRNSCYRLYYALSLDGGETILPNVKASDRPTCPGTPNNWALIGASNLDLPRDLSKEERRLRILAFGVPDRWPNGGDTQGFVAGNDGVFHSAWINGESGVMQLWSKELKIDQTTTTRSPFTNSRKNLSRELVLEISGTAVDFKTHTLSFRVRIVNPLARAIPGPFSVVLEDSPSSSLTDRKSVV